MDLPPWLDDSKSPSPREWDLLGRDCLPHLNKPAKGAVPCVSPLLLQLIFELTAVMSHSRTQRASNTFDTSTKTMMLQRDKGTCGIAWPFRKHHLKINLHCSLPIINGHLIIGPSGRE
jgi:hypothetical protein